MKRIFIFLMLLSVGIAACNKEHSNNSAEDDAEVIAEFDGENIESDYSGNKTNETTCYEFGGVAGIYYGFTAIFRTGNHSSFDITFGTVLTKNLKLTEEEFLGLISPGKKEFGSLGAFSSFPEIKPNRVEISLTDKKGVKWCSTKIKEKHTRYGIEAEIKLEQKDGKFHIENIKKVVLDSGKNGYIIKGHFDCMLFELNGKTSKKMKGKFSGLIDPKI